MRRICIVIVGLAVVLCVTTAGTARAQDKETGSGPVTWEINKAKLPSAPLKAGDTFSVELTAHIERGWHLYSLTPIENGPRPTRITLATGQAFELAGTIKAPDPITARDPNFGVETEYYETSAIFAVPIKVLPAGAAGKATLTVQIRYQTCNDKDCLPPQLVKLPVPVEIAAK